MADTKTEALPLFVVAGMPRGATTFLYHYLAQHPDIFLPFRKETNYFSTNHERGEKWFRSLYADMTDEVIAGDISPPCFLDDKSISRIKSFDGRVKVILVVRDPVEWAVSFYHQFKSINFGMPPLEQYLEKGYSSKIGDQYLSLRFSGSWVTDRINEYQEAFGDDLLIYDFAYFKRNPLAVLQQIEKFLQVSRWFEQSNFDNRRINESKRRNVRLISWLLSREKVIGFVAWLMPKRIIDFCRSLFDRLSSKTAGEASKLDTHDKRELDLARKYFGEEGDRVRALFKSGPILIGRKPAEALRSYE